MPSPKQKTIRVQAVLNKDCTSLKFQFPDGTPADVIEVMPCQKISWELVTPLSNWRTYFLVVFSPLDSPTKAGSLLVSEGRKRLTITLDHLPRRRKGKDPSYKYAFAAVLDQPNNSTGTSPDHDDPHRIIKIVAVDPIIIIRGYREL